MWNKRPKIDKADHYFSLYIREKAGWKCEYCGKDFSAKDRRKYLQNSHYWGRVNESTRFDPDNCMALCAYCHNRLGHGDGRDDYRRIMIQRLGEKRFQLLEIKKNTYKKKDRYLESLLWAQEYNKLKK